MSKYMAQGKLADDLTTTAWLSQTTQQIQVLDYELHATLRVIGVGGALNPGQRSAFIAATSRRNRLMARIVRHIVAIPSE